METVLWQRYFLAPPPVVKHVLRLMDVSLHPSTAYEVNFCF